MYKIKIDLKKLKITKLSY